jgi:single-stranded-DNA-specific exonuclease
MQKCKWNIKSDITIEAKNFSEELKISSILAQLLINRGINTIESARSFFSTSFTSLPDPFLIGDMHKAAQRLADAIQNNEKIFIYGDYDIDGASSIATLFNFISDLGVKPVYYQPERFTDGYGLHVKAIKNIIDQGAQLIVTVDCGTSSLDAANYCKKLGVDLIVTDHHKVFGEHVNAYAFINPHKEGENPVFGVMAGVGVAYYLVIATRKILRDRGFFKERIQEPDLRNYLDMVALGTTADVVPLVGVNRIFVKKGLEIINKRKRKGLDALIDLSRINSEISTESLGFIIGPRLNAPGRMGSASMSVDILLCQDDKKARLIAEQLEQENKKRIQFQNQAWKDVQNIIEDNTGTFAKLPLDERFSLTFAGSEWHQGVIGIVASKSSEKWNKPTAVYTKSEEGLLKGSARSIPGIDIFSIFTEFKDIFENFGGHSMAAGMCIKSDNLAKFEELFEQGVSNAKGLKAIESVLDIDLEINLSDIKMNTVNEINTMAPFGEGNPRPVFCSKGVKVLNKQILKDKHLKLKLSNGIDAIGFNMAELADNIGQTVNIAFKPIINEWNGSRYLQYLLVDAE